MQIRSRPTEKHDSEGEKSGEDHSHGGVFLEAAVAFHKSRGDCAKQTRGEGSQRQRQPGDVCQHDPWQDGM